MTVRYFRSDGSGAVHSVRVDEQGRPEGRGSLCGAATVIVEAAGGIVAHEVMPWALPARRCPRCQYVEAARGPVKAWERGTE